MESVSYTAPVSWEDKGLDWSNPDPRNIDYLIALFEAAKERSSLVSWRTPFARSNTIHRYYMHGRPLSVALFQEIQGYISDVALGYLNITEFPAAAFFSSAPKWTATAIANAFGETYHRLYALSALDEAVLSAWLTAARAFLLKLRFVAVDSYWRNTERIKTDGASRNYDYGPWPGYNTETLFAAVKSAAGEKYLSIEWREFSTSGNRYKVIFGTYYAETWVFDREPYGLWSGIYMIQTEALPLVLNPLSTKFKNPECAVYVWLGPALNPEAARWMTVNSIFDADSYFGATGMKANAYNRILLPVVDNVIDFTTILPPIPPAPPLSGLPPAPVDSVPYRAVSRGFYVDGDKPTVVIADYGDQFQFSGEPV